MKKSRRINLKKERVVLSDILPYETPITFSNRFFYDFAIENRVSVDDYSMSWGVVGSAEESLICMILGISDENKSKIITEDNRRIYKESNSLVTMPFHYGISHKESSFRTLSIMHPRNQLQTVSFYEKYKEIILYFSERSKFSLRAPSRIANTKYFDDERKSGSVVVAGSKEKHEDREYKNLKSFFGYNKISNIHQFFESIDYHRCEQKYNKMAQLDVSKCFDSIYTHSVAWSVFGREIVKNTMAVKGSGCLRKSFADDFDRLMQRQNYNETNGILIGPELSRIFAEIILQSVDCIVLDNLAKSNIVYGNDYEVFRYVDDFFVFYNDEQVYKSIIGEIEAGLNIFKLSLNMEKELVYHKPIITEITIAKRKISKLLSEKISIDVIDDIDDIDDEGERVIKGRIDIRSGSLITQYKSILSESGADYKSVINYSLAIVEGRVKKIIRSYKKISQDDVAYQGLIKSIHAILEFCFFIYSVAPRVNTTIKLSRVLKVLMDFSRSSHVSVDDMHQIFKRISENIDFVINKYESASHTQVETLYLLTVMAELGKDYWLDEKVLVKYFSGEYLPGGDIFFDRSLNYFSITVLLFYIKDKVRYDTIREGVKSLIKEKMSNNKEHLKRNSEFLMLALDCIACPYLGANFKKEILGMYEITENSLQEKVILCRANWFTKWTDFEFGRELDAKQSQEVY